MEVMLSEFDYFSPTPVQASILEEYDEAIPASAAVTAGATIDFTIKGEPNVYRDLSNSYLVVQCKVTAQDGVTAIAAGDAVAPVNLLLHSMFSSIDITVCGTRITDRDVHYPYRAFLETLLTFGDDVLRTRAKLAGWVLDLDAAAMDRVIIAAAGGVNPNPQFVERRLPIVSSHTYTLVGRPHADIFHQNLDIPPGCEVVVTLTPSESKFALMAIAAATFKLVITSAKLYVRSKLVAPELIVAHRTMLERSNFHIPYTAVNIRKFQIGAAVTDYEVSDIFKTKLPKRIVIGLVSHARSAGAYELNPFKFENFGLTDIALSVGGQSVPREPLTTDYHADANNYGRAYLNTLAALGMDIGNRALAIPPHLWAAAYNLYAFKLVPGPIDDGPMETIKTTANVSLHLTFAAATAAVIDLIIYSETGAVLDITKLNSAIVL